MLRLTLRSLDKAGRHAYSSFSCKRGFSSGSVATGLVTSAQRVTQEHINAFLPSSLRRLVRVRGVPPEALERLYHKKLDKICTNPAAILRSYMCYTQCKTKGSLALQLRYLTALGHCFGFNSFWATEDKQRLHRMLSFRSLVYDVYQNRKRLKAAHVPRLIYALTALEYRSQHLMPVLLDILYASVSKYRPPTLATLGLCLGYMGIGDSHGPNQFGPISDLSHDYTGLLAKICRRVARHVLNDEYRKDRSLLLGPFEASGLAFAMVMANLYDLALDEPHIQGGRRYVLPVFLQEACRELTIVNLPHSGWVQFFLYQTLYCTDVEKPEAEVQIKRSIPHDFQKSLHLRWLDSILLNGQPQGMEQVQHSVHSALTRLSISDALINCSSGRSWDEQHCWFAGHLIKSRRLALHYDYAKPLGPKRPKPTGWLQLQARMFRHFGYHTAYIHKCFWSSLSQPQQDMQLMKLLSQFPQVAEPIVTAPETPTYASLPKPSEDADYEECATLVQKEKRLIQRKRRTYRDKKDSYLDIRVVL